jgi:hypothetical protein
MNPVQELLRAIQQSSRYFQVVDAMVHDDCEKDQRRIHFDKTSTLPRHPGALTFFGKIRWHHKRLRARHCIKAEKGRGRREEQSCP